jgi:8-oxo-dGTP diphosphatase
VGAATPTPGVAPTAAEPFSLDDLSGLPPEPENYEQTPADEARGEEVAAELGAWLEQDVVYLGTEGGLRTKTTSRRLVEFRIDRLAVGSDVVAFGDYWRPEALYLERECGSEGCQENAYVRFADANDLRRVRGGPDEHRNALRQGIANARAARALCNAHRVHKEKIQLPPCPPVEGDRGEEYRSRDLHGEGVWPVSPDDMSRRYGAIAFDSEGRVLLREPRNHYGGYHWTFPKGGMDGSETPVEAALRETLEETGMMAAVVGHVPGKFQAMTEEWTDEKGKHHPASPGSANYYYLIRDSGDRHPQLMNGETARCVWMTPKDARELISRTTYQNGRDRDLAILDAAVKAHDELQKGRRPGLIAKLFGRQGA